MSFSLARLHNAAWGVLTLHVPVTSLIQHSMRCRARTRLFAQGILRSHPQFMRLDPRAIAAVIDVCTLRYTTEAEVLVEQGQPGNYFFVVKEGTFALKVPSPLVPAREASKSHL